MQPIMIVDDDEGARKIITIMLEKGGYNVVHAAHAQEALQLLESVQPALVIVDIMMPGELDGVELCAHIRKRPATAKTPILMLSARTDAETILRSDEAGASDYLMKPILQNNLVGKVRELLSGQ
jgi:DNA-binding response OmpR family regulator